MTDGYAGVRFRCILICRYGSFHFVCESVYEVMVSDMCCVGGTSQSRRCHMFVVVDRIMFTLD